MNNETETNTAEVTNADEKDVETEVEVEEKPETDTEESKESESKDQNIEIDYDAEIEKERKGRPDPKIAEKAFKERESKRVEEPELGEKPLTRKELEEILTQERKVNFEIRALQIARGLSSSDKEAQLVVEKWKNRTFPFTLTIEEQIEEAYAITHRKKLIGERNEALRALRGKSSINRDTASTHRDEPIAGEPNMAEQDKMALSAVGFAWNGKDRRWEKKLSNGNLLVRDSKTKQTRMIRKS